MNNPNNSTPDFNDQIKEGMQKVLSRPEHKKLSKIAINAIYVEDEGGGAIIKWTRETAF